MPRVTEHPTTDRQAKPDFRAVIEHLKAIATTSADNALTEGPVNEDRHLLDLCAETLHALVHAERAYRSRSWDPGMTDAEKAAWRVKDAELMGEYWAGTESAKPALGRIKKMKATTAAGSTPRLPSSGHRRPEPRGWRCHWRRTCLIAQV